MTQVPAQLGGVDNRSPDVGMWRLPLHAVKHDRDLQARRRLAGDEAKFRQGRSWIFSRAEICRGIAHGATEPAFDQARPRCIGEATRQQPPARRLQAKQPAMRGGYPD
jgi:hypothetical protein